LHGGAAAVFGVSALGEAAALEAVAHVPSLDPVGHSSTIWTQAIAGRAAPARMHVDASVARDHAGARVAAALAAGRIIIADADAPDRMNPR